MQMQTDKLEAIVGILTPTTLAAILHDLCEYAADRQDLGLTVEQRVVDAADDLWEAGQACQGNLFFLNMVVTQN